MKDSTGQHGYVGSANDPPKANTLKIQNTPKISLHSFISPATYPGPHPRRRKRIFRPGEFADF